MRHLLNPLDFSVEETNELLTLASDIEHNLKKYAHVCDGKKLATLFSMNQVQEPVLALNPLC